MSTRPTTRLCYFCGIKTPVLKPDVFLLLILENGRSPVFCRPHWKKLREHAPPHIIEHYRRTSLKRPELRNYKTATKLDSAIKALKRMS